MGENALKPYPWYGSTHRVYDNVLKTVLARTWKPQLAITGANGLPEVETAGNVMLPYCTVKVSLRCPPTLNSAEKAKELKELLTSNPPYGADVTFDILSAGDGWSCPTYSEWLDNALVEAGKTYFTGDVLSQGEGGSIPLMGLLNQIWPKAQFIVTGVLGPESNAHGPNEFLHLEYTKKLTQAMAHVLARSAEAK